MFKPLVVLGSLCLLASCSFVKITPAGDNVAVLTANDVTRCTRQGDLVVSVLDRVGVKRAPDKVEKDLQTMARNTAAQRGGDAIVASSAVYDGKRNYDIYRCRP